MVTSFWLVADAVLLVPVVDAIDADYVQDAVISIYEEYANDIKQEVENELIEEGYEYETTEN